MLLPYKCLFHVISVGVFLEGTWNSWVNSASYSPSLGPLDSHHSRASLCFLLSRKQAKDWGADLRPGLTYAFPPVICCGSKRRWSSQRSPRLVLGWADHPSAGSSTMEQRWSMRVSSYSTSQSLCLCRSPFVPFDQVSSQGRKSKLTLNLQSEYFPEE